MNGRNHRASLLLCITLILLSTACSSVSPTGTTTTATPAANVKPNVFDEYLNSEFDPADGFDFPVGDRDGKGTYEDKVTGKRHSGWYVATQFGEEYTLGLHPGEDWNGNGGGDTDLGQDVYSVANGRVVFAGHCGRLWGNLIIIEHLFYENHEKRKLRSVYAHLSEIKVEQGQKVRRRQLIGTVGKDPEKLFAAHLHLELRWDETLPPAYWPSSDGKDRAWVSQHYAAPTAFIDNHRKLHVPTKESTLILVDHTNYKMRMYQSGVLQGEYEVSFGQGRGQKRTQGDNKTPKGMYFVIQKYRGQFGGSYGKYYGGHWIKLNYPNKYDAAWGRSTEAINPHQEARISESWERRGPTLESTRLGGGIGFHGWIKEWDNNGPRHLSWGCVVMHLYDIQGVYDQIPEGAMVVLF
jgi:murein DD-endopeptidase MepM/ murein hydrolase activator NlpD